MSTKETVRAFVEQHKLLVAGERVLLALSGGADSVALLSLLLAMGMEVEALHVHHGIRGAEADRDAAFCQTLCRDLGVPCRVVYTDVPAIAKARKCGIEEAARDERYRLLHEVADGRKICVAHNATDNFETVLFHLVRGTGSAGLAGIPPRRGQIVRPCLCVSKAELTAYVEEMGLSFVQDSTNEDTRGTRSFLRHRVLPLLRELRPDADRAVLAVSEKLRKEVAYFAKEAANIPKEADPAVLADLAEPIFVRWLSARLEEVGAPLTEQTVAAARGLLLGGRGDARDVAGATIYHDGDRITVRARTELPTWDGAPLALTADTPCQMADWGVLATTSEKNAEAFQNIYKYSTTARVSFAKIGTALFLRGRKAGDRMMSGGMHRSAKNLLQAANIPARERENLPFVCDEHGILWIPNCPVRDGAQAEENGLILVFGQEKSKED